MNSERERFFEVPSPNKNPPYRPLPGPIPGPIPITMVR